MTSDDTNQLLVVRGSLRLVFSRITNVVMLLPRRQGYIHSDRESLNGMTRVPLALYTWLGVERMDLSHEDDTSTRRTNRLGQAFRLVNRCKKVGAFRFHSSTDWSVSG